MFAKKISQLSESIHEFAAEARGRAPGPFSAYAEVLAHTGRIEDVPGWCDEDACVDDDRIGPNSAFTPYWTCDHPDPDADGPLKICDYQYPYVREGRLERANFELDLFDLVKYYEKREWIFASLQWWHALLQ